MSSINIENLGKRYRIGTRQQEKTFREAIVDTVKAPLKNLSHLRSLTRFNEEESESIIWALKNVSFEVKQGEAIGIIGPNGAGKSTLLKILSRITEPTTGFAEIYGRVSSLLEVGTGFHPELTGRENVYLNATILGMRKKEIDRKFDEIVEFSGVEKFIDTPVKRYSSGMQVRLAFAVAANLEPEVLIIDEVLAVGDAEFQKKCLGKMSAVAKEGRTVLFVSHNMGAIKQLCQRCILLDQGTVIENGLPSQVIESYISGSVHEQKSAVVDLSLFPRHTGDQRAITEAWIENEDGNATQELPMGAKVKICYRFKANRILKNPTFGLSVYNSFGDTVFSFASYLVDNKKIDDCQEGVAVFDFDEFPLLPGNYAVTFSLSEGHNHALDSVAMALHFSVANYDLFGTGRPYESGHGVIFLNGNVSIRN